MAFWKIFPYALSTHVAGAIILSAAILSLLYLQETLHRKLGSSSAQPALSTKDLVYAPGVRTILYLHFHVIVLSLSFTAISTVMMYTSVENGGYGFSDQNIALFLATSGAGQSFWTLLVFPYLQRRHSTGTVLKLCGFLWPSFILTFPMLNEILRRGWSTVFWLVALSTWALGNSVAMSLGRSLAFPESLQSYMRSNISQRASSYV